MIESILIQGAASFGNEPQRLDGLSQLNFLFGSNGAGKTTISRIIADAVTFPSCTVSWKGGTRNRLIYRQSEPGMTADTRRRRRPARFPHQPAEASASGHGNENHGRRQPERTGSHCENQCNRRDFGNPHEFSLRKWVDGHWRLLRIS